MMRRGVTIIVQPDGAAESRAYRISVFAWRAAIGAGLGVLGLIALAVALWGPIVRTAARVPGLEREAARLRSDNAKVRELVAALDSVESRYEQVRSMVGADIVPDVSQAAQLLPVAPAVRAVAEGAAERYLPGASVPAHWPLDGTGYVTRGQLGPDSRDGSHPGVDLAVPTGTVVRAAGGGQVVEAGEDPDYGLFVLVQHPEDYQTMYGHLSRLVVRTGQAIGAGEVIGLSGDTGRSTAPHLHFEVRRGATAVDPLTVVKEDR